MEAIFPEGFLQLWMYGMVALLFAGYVMLIVWGYIDAEARDRSGPVNAIVMIILGPLGLLWWVLRRPPKPGEESYYD